MPSLFTNAFCKYAFDDPAIFLEAQCATPAPVKIIDRSNPDNNRESPDGNLQLALVGDAVIKTVLATEWYDTPETRSRGRIWFDTMVSNRYLALVAQYHGLDKRMIALNASRSVETPCPGLVVEWKSSSKPDRGAKGSYPNRCASTLEAIIGAVFIDSNYDRAAAKAVMDRLGVTPPRDDREFSAMQEKIGFKKNRKIASRHKRKGKNQNKRRAQPAELEATRF